MPVLMRTLLETDLARADEILCSAFQRSGSWRSDLLLYRAIQPDGLFVAERGGVPAGMVCSVIYPDFAYIGLMAVHSAHQHQGIGLALMRHVTAWLEQHFVSRIALDASPAGQPLYARLGFQPQESVQVFQRIGPVERLPSSLHVQTMTAGDLDRLIKFDAQIFGTERSRVLHALWQAHPGRAFILLDGNGALEGYLFAQMSRIGPWAANNAEGAEILLRAALSLSFPGPVLVAVPTENSGAAPLLCRFGFAIVRTNRHMARGGLLPGGQREKVYAQTSLFLG